MRKINNNSSERQQKNKNSQPYRSEINAPVTPQQTQTQTPILQQTQTPILQQPQTPILQQPQIIIQQIPVPIEGPVLFPIQVPVELPVANTILVEMINDAQNAAVHHMYRADENAAIVNQALSQLMAEKQKTELLQKELDALRLQGQQKSPPRETVNFIPVKVNKEATDQVKSLLGLTNADDVSKNSALAPTGKTDPNERSDTPDKDSDIQKLQFFEG